MTWMVSGIKSSWGTTEPCSDVTLISPVHEAPRSVTGPQHPWNPQTVLTTGSKSPALGALRVLSFVLSAADRTLNKSSINELMTEQVSVMTTVVQIPSFFQLLFKATSSRKPSLTSPALPSQDSYSAGCAANVDMLPSVLRRGRSFLCFLLFLVPAGQTHFFNIHSFHSYHTAHTV